MDTHEKIKEAEENNSKHLEEDVRLDIEGKEKQQMADSSSPSHEFSFSVSLQPSSTNKTTSPPSSSFTIDLSPADDIFFHGHLLPLQLLSHLPLPPRSSTNSIETHTLPIRELLNHKTPNNFTNCNSHEHYQNTDRNTSEKAKSKPFSLLGLRWRKGYYDVEEQETKTKVKQLNRKLGFNFRHVLKRYARMMHPFLNFRGRGRSDDIQLNRQCYSFSGNLSFRNKPEIRGRSRGEFSAPASMKTSPTNSGVLLSTTTRPPSTNDSSTMEELQAAIQAAIAHCKNSIVKEERPKC